MTLRAAAVVPSAPLLVPALAGGAADLDAALRRDTRAAVSALLADGGGGLVVVSGGPRTAQVRGTWDWTGFGVPSRGTGAPALPLGLAVGAWLLDEHDPALARTYQAVSDEDGPDACRRLGQGLAERDVRLLVVGDGSARRTEKAPGSLDARAEPFDRAVEGALRDGDPAALLDLDADLARQLLAGGRAAWQVLAGAAGDRRWRSEVRHAAAPYGVGYLVCSWTRNGA